MAKTSCVCLCVPATLSNSDGISWTRPSVSWVVMRPGVVDVRNSSFSSVSVVQKGRTSRAGGFWVVRGGPRWAPGTCGRRRGWQIDHTGGLFTNREKVPGPLRLRFRRQSCRPPASIAGPSPPRAGRCAGAVAFLALDVVPAGGGQFRLRVDREFHHVPHRASALAATATPPQ